MNITHRKSQAWLAEYAAGELGLAEYQAMTTHLARCKVCQQDLAETRHIHQLLRSLAVQPFPSMGNSTSLTDLDAIFATQACETSIEGGQYRSMPELARVQRRPQRTLLSLLAAVLLALILVFSTAFVLNLELGWHAGPAAQQHSTPTTLPRRTCGPGTPIMATPTAKAAGTATSAPPTSLPTPTPTHVPQECSQ